MYYLELIERFWNFNENNNVGSSAIALYLYLLKLGYENDSYEVRVSDVLLSKELAMTRKTIKSTKDKMKAYGLIDFSTKNGIACSYRLLLNYPVQKYSGTGIEKLELITSENNNEEINSSPVRVSKLNDCNNVEIIDNIKTIPSFTEFIEFAQSLPLYHLSLNEVLRNKYNSWKSSGWYSSSKRPITNWQSTLKSVLPYLTKNSDSTTDNSINIPNIERPLDFNADH